MEPDSTYGDTQTKQLVAEMQAPQPVAQELHPAPSFQVPKGQRAAGGGHPGGSCQSVGVGANSNTAVRVVAATWLSQQGRPARPAPVGRCTVVAGVVLLPPSGGVLCKQRALASKASGWPALLELSSPTLLVKDGRSRLLRGSLPTQAPPESVVTVCCGSSQPLP